MGLSLETSDPLAVGEKLIVDLPLCGATCATIVWREGSLFGCEFEETVPPAAISAALLRAAPDADDEITEADAALGSEDRQAGMVSHPKNVGDHRPVSRVLGDRRSRVDLAAVKRNA